MTAWYETQQVATRDAADRFGLPYTLTELDAIDAFRTEGASVTDIALAAGRTYAGISALINDHDRYLRTRAAATPKPAQNVVCPACWLVHAGECR